MCDLKGIQLLNTCDRLSIQFPCWRGCSKQKDAIDAPAFDGYMTDEIFAGSTCVIGDVEEIESVPLTCSGKHPKTMRLCSCGEAKYINVWSIQSESCSITCLRAGATCNEDGFDTIDCGTLARHDQDRCGGNRCRIIDAGDVFVAARDLEVGMCFVDGSKKKKVGNELCEEDYGSSRQRLCPCRSLKYN